MAGNVRGAMRPQGRSPPFLLIGLCVALCILGFNYWSLSYRNRDMASQIGDIQDQLRRSMSKRMTAERRGASVVDELKKCESTLDMEKNEIARKESEINTLSQQLKSKVTELTEYETKLKEIETNLKTCEENNIGINQELQKKKEELKTALQQAPVQDADRCKLCKGQWNEEKMTFLNGIEKVLGPTALLRLREAGVDIGHYAQEIDAQNKLKVEQQNPQANGQAIPQKPMESSNVANGPANPNPAQGQSLPVQPVQDKNQFPQQPAVQVQQPAQGPAAVIMDKNNNVPQDQSVQVNPPVAGANAAETNVLRVDGEDAAKANGDPSQNAVANNLPLGNPQPPNLGANFVPMANPAIENAGQVANDVDGQQANQPPPEKAADPAQVGNQGPQPVVPDDAAAAAAAAAQNRVERPPSDLNKTTAGSSLLILDTSNTPLPKEAPTAPNMSLSSRKSTLSVQTDTQAPLHASQSNLTAYNQTLDLRFGPGLSPANNVAEANAQINYKQNAGFEASDDNANKHVNPDSSKVRAPPPFDNNILNNFNVGSNNNNAMQVADVDDVLHQPNFPQKPVNEEPPSHLSDAEEDRRVAEQFPWLRRDHDGQHGAGIQEDRKESVPSLQGKASDDYNDFKVPLGMVANSQILQDEDGIERMQHNMKVEDERILNHVRNIR